MTTSPKLCSPSEEQEGTVTRMLAERAVAQCRASKPGYERLVALLLFLIGVCLGMLFLPVGGRASSAAPSQRGGVQAPSTQNALGPTCGHPKEVFQRLGLPLERVPNRTQLLQLPRPDLKHPMQAGGVTLTYDPKKDQLCTLGWQSLWTRFVTGPQPSATSTPTQSATASDQTSSPSAPGSSWVQRVLSDLWQSFAQGFSHLLTGIIDWATTFGFLFVTPKNLTYGQPIVENLSRWVLGIMDGAVTLVLVIGGYGYMSGRLGDFRETAIRLIVATIAGNFSLFFLAQFIELHNTLCLGLQGALAAAGVHLQFPQDIIDLPGAGIYEGIMYLSELIVAVLLVLQMLARLALLDLLLVVAPLGFLCFALPQTAAWARLWAQAFVSTLLVQFFQLLCIGLGSALIGGTIQATWKLGTGIGHPDLRFNIVTMLVALAAYVLAFKIPGMLLSHILRAGVSGVHRDVSKAVATIESVASFVTL